MVREEMGGLPLEEGTCVSLQQPHSVQPQARHSASPGLGAIPGKTGFYLPGPLAGLGD